MKSRLFACAAFIAVVLLSPRSWVEACGPFFEPDIFVRQNMPDHLEDFAKGNLDILQKGYDSDEFAVAYLYLRGGKLSQLQQHEYGRSANPASNQIDHPSQPAAQANENSSPSTLWQQTRARYSPAQPSAPETQAPSDGAANGIVYDPDKLNCPQAAFQNAYVTLTQRASSWGKDSPFLADWIRGQDAVFSNCVASLHSEPAAAPPDAPVLLRADRAYQIAAASFYGSQLDQAVSQFEAIANDKSSPWNVWGQYLAARALVRKAFALGKASDPYGGELATFDLATMQAAQKKLESALAQQNPLPSRKIVANELSFIRLRTEPDKRIEEICAALAGPAPDDNFLQDQQDLSFVLLKNIAISSPPPLLTWIAALRASDAKTSYRTWNRDRSLPWLVAAMMTAESTDDFSPQLLNDAERIKPDSPAYDTVFFNRVRLLIDMNRKDEARTLLDQALPAIHKQPPSSKQNALLSERLAVARSFDELLEFAPRADFNQSPAAAHTFDQACHAPTESQTKPDNCPQDGSYFQENLTEFDTDSEYVLNRQTPLTLLIEAASSTHLPKDLRQNIVLAAWTRSVVLEDNAGAVKLAPMLPEPLRKTAGTDAGFSANLTILRNPGLRPYLEAGTTRLTTYNSLDNYRDNWWADAWVSKETTESLKPYQRHASESLTPQQKTQGTAEFEKLAQLPCGAAVIGQRVIDYAKNNPSDAEVPEALALTVRATRYGQSSTDYEKAKRENTAVSKTAFELLHTRYPKSPWTLRTRYYF